MNLRSSPQDQTSIQTFLATLTEDEMVVWMKHALAGNVAPLSLAPGDMPSAELAAIPKSLTGDVLARFRTALTLLLKDFSEAPFSWKTPHADELIGLAALLGTSGLPGREPWDLAFPLSLKRMVEVRPTNFAKLPSSLRLNILAVLASGPSSLDKAFWERVAVSSPDYVPVSWRGLLRDDWSAACEMLSSLPDDEIALNTLRYHARYASRRIKADETGRLRAHLEASLPRAKVNFRDLLKRETGLVESKAIIPSTSEDSFRDAEMVCRALGFDKTLANAVRYARKEFTPGNDREWLEVVRNILLTKLPESDRLILLMKRGEYAIGESEAMHLAAEMGHFIGEALLPTEV